MVKKAMVGTEVFEESLQKIMSCGSLDELVEIGKEMVNYEMNGYKKALIHVYKTKRKEIVQKLIQENGIFANLYFLIKTSSGNTLKQVGKLLYNIKNCGILSKGELNYLFEIYEQKRDREVEEESEED